MKKCVCGYETSHSSNFSTHKKRCKQRTFQEQIELLQNENSTLRSQAADLTPSAEDRFQSMIFDMNISIATLQASVESLRGEVMKLKKAPAVKSPTTVHIHIYPYKGEPTTALPAISEVRKLFVNPANSIAGVVRLKLKNPQTRNIRITNARSNLIQTHTGSWTNCNKKRGLLDCAEFHLELLKSNYGADENPLWNAWYESSGLDFLEGAEEKIQNPAWKAQIEKVENVLLSDKA